MRFGRNDAHEAAVVALVVANVTVNGGEDGPVATHTHTVAGVEPSSELAHDDVAGFDELAVAALYAAVLWV